MLGNCTGTITLDGTKYSFSGITFNSGQTTTGSKVIMTKTANIAHNTDGSKTVSCSASFVTGVSSGTVSASASKTLTTIPRKSSLTVGNGYLGTAQTLTVTRQSTSFTHTITATCGSSTSTVCTKSSNTAISFTPPLSWASNNTTGISVSVTYTITTYNGSTSVGSNSYTKTCTIPVSVKPSCTITVSETTTYTSEYGGLVQGYSKVKVVVTPTLAYGSSIASYSTTVDGKTYAASTFTTSELSSSGALTITTTVTDKRGRKGTASTTINVMEYSPPAISSLDVHRCDEDGTANDQGSFVKVVFSYSVSPLDDDANRCWSTVEYKKTSESEYVNSIDTPLDDVFTVTDRSVIFAADDGSSYDVSLVVEDGLVTVRRTTAVSTAVVLMHWKADGTGLAVGKISEESDCFDVGFRTRHYGGVLQPVLEAGTDFDAITTPNTYDLKSCNTAEYLNCPLTSGTGTLKIETCGESGQIHQIVTKCHKTAPLVYERFYYQSEWGEWVCTSDYGGKLLASPDLYMNSSQTVELAEAISKQPHGIVLVFSPYSSSVINHTFQCHFVPKMQIAMYPGSSGHNMCFTLIKSDLSVFGYKLLKISDTKIVGLGTNTVSGTGTCGITYDNSAFVLRYVIGV